MPPSTGDLIDALTCDTETGSFISSAQPLVNSNLENLPSYTPSEVFCGFLLLGTDRKPLQTKLAKLSGGELYNATFSPHTRPPGAENYPQATGTQAISRRYSSLVVAQGTFHALFLKFCHLCLWFLIIIPAWFLVPVQDFLFPVGDEPSLSTLSFEIPDAIDCIRLPGVGMRSFQTVGLPSGGSSHCYSSLTE